MCGIRKGTSTRKPRITQVTQQFAKIENQIEQERMKEKRKEMIMRSRASRKNTKQNRFENAQTISITVNDVTVFITDVELSNLECDADENPKSVNSKSSRSKLELDSKDSVDTTSSDNESAEKEHETKLIAQEAD